MKRVKRCDAKTSFPIVPLLNFQSIPLPISNRLWESQGSDYLEVFREGLARSVAFAFKVSRAQLTMATIIDKAFGQDAGLRQKIHSTIRMLTDLSTALDV
jgi:hypothetical protein